MATTKKVAKTVTKKVSRKKAVASTPAKPRAARPKTATKRAAAAGFSMRQSKPKLTPEERFNKIQEISYFLAEQDGFRGAPDCYWFSAEAKVAEQYS